ncbi:MAG: TonB-dependent receptor, partial [Sphingobacteriales bacterium]
MRTCITTVFLFATALLRAQPGMVSGQVVDGQLQQPVAGASVQTASGQMVFSDELGNFRIAGLSAGEAQLIVSCIGYRPDTVFLKVTAGPALRTRIALRPETVQLSQVVVSAFAAASAGNSLRVDMRFRPVNTGQELLRIVPGLFIAQHAGGGKAEQLFLRGYDVDHGTDVAVSVDGLPVNLRTHAHGQGYADAHFLIPETVERIDFDKGPYNAGKGDFATAGWVDFQTKDFLSRNTVKAEGGSFGYRRGTALLRLFDRNSATAHQQVYVASEYFAADGYFDAVQLFHRFNLFGKYTLVAGNHTRLLVSGSLFDSRWNA